MAATEWAGLSGDEDERAGTEVLVVDAGTAITAADRAQIDLQIATAKQYPRNALRAQQEAMALATMDEETAESMFYALPRTQDGKKIFIEGPSVRFAEIVSYCWGNIRCEARVVAIDETHVTAQATCLDLERNKGSRIEVKRRITNSRGRRYNEDMITTTGNAACSIALRNAIFDTIPFALFKKVYAEARKTATGGAKPIEERRQRALSWFARVGAEEARVLALLGVETVNEITEEHLVHLSGLKTAIQDGDTTVERAFGHPNGAEDSRAEDIDRRTAEKAAQVRQQIKEQQKKQEAPKQDEEKSVGKAARVSRARQRIENNTAAEATPGPQEQPAPAAATSPLGEAIEDLRGLVDDLVPEGGDAPVSLRTRIAEAAREINDAELAAQVNDLAHHPDLGKKQATLLNTRISMVVAAMEGEAENAGPEPEPEPEPEAEPEPEPEPKKPSDPRLAELHEKYMKLVEQQGIDEGVRLAFQRELKAKDLVKSADESEWSKFEYQQAMAELQMRGGNVLD